jgi:hypothetical protein
MPAAGLADSLTAMLPLQPAAGLNVSLRLTPAAGLAISPSPIETFLLAVSSAT